MEKNNRGRTKAQNPHLNLKPCKKLEPKIFIHQMSVSPMHERIKEKSPLLPEIPSQKLHKNKSSKVVGYKLKLSKEMLNNPSLALSTPSTCGSTGHRSTGGGAHSGGGIWKTELLKNLEDEEKECKGDELQLIDKFIFCFDEHTKRAIGFKPVDKETI